MRFIVDECTGNAVAAWLLKENHDVFSVYDKARGINDTEVIDRAFKENRIVITNDKDFGEKIFRERFPHHGIILLRLNDERSANKIDVLKNLLQQYSEQIPNNFIVATEDKVRIVKI